MIILNNSLTFWTLAVCVVVGIPASLIFGVSISRKALSARRSGVAVSSSKAEYRRAEVPLLYWLTLGLQGFNAVACFVVALALAGFTVLFVLGSRQGHNVSRPRVEIMAIAAAAESYKADHGHYPTGDEATVARALTGAKPDGKLYLEWPARNIAPSGALLDPWGTPYHFKSGEFLEIQSAGPNKRFEDPSVAGRDDISTE